MSESKRIGGYTESELLSIIGDSGLRRGHGRVLDEHHPKLRGRLAATVYRQMRDNDPTVGALAYLIESWVLGIDWRVESASPGDDAADEAADFVETVFRDMDHTLDDFVIEALSALWFGWAFFETVYKLRVGPDEEDPSRRSDHTDRRYGIRRLAGRAQTTLERWDFDPNGDAIGWWQRPPPSYSTVYLPFSKGVHIRMRTAKNNPEGRSFLRNAVRPWYFVTRLEEIEAMGIERETVGMPVATVPPSVAAGLTESDRTLLSAIQSRVQQARMDERAGFVFPAEEYTDKGETVKTGFTFRLVTSGGRRSIEIRPSIEAHKQEIAMTVLANFLMLGMNNVGSNAIAKTGQTTFGMSLHSIVSTIREAIDHQVIRPLMQLNGFPRETWPHMGHTDVESPSLAEVADYIGKTVGAGAITPDDELEDHLRRYAGLPAAERDETDDMMIAPDGGDVASDKQDQAMNEIQIRSAMTIVQQVAQRALPRQSGIAMLTQFYSLTTEQAEAIMGEAGQTFFIESTDASDRTS